MYVHQYLFYRLQLSRTAIHSPKIKRNQIQNYPKMIQITNKADCCGCTACASVCAHHAITLKSDNEGFLYPIINKDSCIECGLCEKVCPILQRKKQELNPNQLHYKALRIKDTELLNQSSSGGAFIAVASYIIKREE